ncbi:glutamate-cysteine ligase family protein [Pseudomonas aeruginosa]
MFAERQVEVASSGVLHSAEAARFHGHQPGNAWRIWPWNSACARPCVGTPPFADWRRARSNPAAHFARLRSEDQGQAWAQAWSAACTCMWRYSPEPRPLAEAPARAAAGWPLLALSASSPFRGGRRSGLVELSTALWRRVAEDEHSSCLARTRDALIAATWRCCARPAASAGGWPGLVDDPAVIPCADPGAAYHLRRSPAPGRRAESLAGLFRALVGKRWARTRRALPVARGRLPGREKATAGAALRLRRLPFSSKAAA